MTPEAELPTAVRRGISYSGLPNRYCIYTGSSPYAYGQKSFDFTSPCRFLCCADRRERHALQHVPAMQPHQRTTSLRFVAAGPRRGTEQQQLRDCTTVTDVFVAAGLSTAFADQLRTAGIDNVNALKWLEDGDLIQHVPAMQPHQRTTFLCFVAAGPRRPAATGVGGPVPM